MGNCCTTNGQNDPANVDLKRENQNFKIDENDEQGGDKLEKGVANKKQVFV